MCTKRRGHGNVDMLSADKASLTVDTFALPAGPAAKVEVISAERVGAEWGETS